VIATPGQTFKIICVVVACAVAGTGGCARVDGPARIAVFGTVTSEAGEPVSGMISFLPQTGTEGPAATASLIDGTYQFTTKNGPVAGRYRVLVVKQSADWQFKSAPTSADDGPSMTGATPDDQPAASEEWSFTANVSPDDVEFDFQVSDAATSSS
jgi:hypothetical protein